MTNETYTENLSDFGTRELRLLKDILDAWLDKAGLPIAFDDSGVKPAFNRNSGYVFLVNEDYQACMINPDTGNLEIWHNTPHNGYEGFLVDIYSRNTSLATLTKMIESISHKQSNMNN